MTKAQYIKAHPKSRLAARLACNNWPDDAVIEIIGGLDAPNTKQSNLYKALLQSATRQYCIGGHRLNGPDGWWMAVY